MRRITLMTIHKTYEKRQQIYNPLIKRVIYLLTLLICFKYCHQCYSPHQGLSALSSLRTLNIFALWFNGIFLLPSLLRLLFTTDGGNERTETWLVASDYISDVADVDIRRLSNVGRHDDVTAITDAKHVFRVVRWFGRTVRLK